MSIHFRRCFFLAFFSDDSILIEGAFLMNSVFVSFYIELAYDSNFNLLILFSLKIVWQNVISSSHVTIRFSH